ncbi:sodium-dependent transporter [Geofilum sp. OHC36d9]|uniref:sodium-dependent transporter n=1 Tax=Geofilum sp. OHC36d9 TaxID=3458413 RepID=UPI00403350A9
MNQGNRDGFASRFGVIAAAAGSAVGLGNVWRFPYVVGENGGGAFLLVYLGFVLAIGVPVMLSELLIGRKSQRNIFGAFHVLAPGRPWFLIGLMGVGAAFMILSFYSVVAGWTMEYLYLAFTNQLATVSSVELNQIFSEVKSGAWRPVFFMVVFMAMTAFIVKSGINKGIEKYSKLLMPVLFVIIVLLCIRSVTLEGASAGLEFLFRPDFSRITPHVVLEALGQAFFSLSLGMGVMATYGSYIKKGESLGKTAISVSLTDTAIAILSGIAIFPAVFAFGIEPGAGPGLVFVTLPGIFSKMIGGYFFAFIFFALLVIAALTSSISLLEVVVAYFTEELKMRRRAATWLAAGLMTLLGLICAFNSTVFNLFDNTSSNILLPLGGFFIVVFVGWFLGHNIVRSELEADGRVARYFHLFLVVIKIVAPVAIALVFLNQLGLINF